MGNYWAEIADKNQTQRQTQLLKNHLNPSGIVLDLACGTGRHTLTLQAEGFDMVGLDVSAKLLQIAKQRYPAVQVIRGDLRFLPFKSEAFVAVVSMDTSLGYLPTQEDDLQSLAEARRVLTQGGVLVVDVFNRERLSQKYSESHTSDWMEYPSFYLKQKRQVPSAGERLYDVWVVRDKSTGRLVEFMHSVRLYRLDVLRGLLEKAGFAVREVLGDYEGQPFSRESARLIFVASARVF